MAELKRWFRFARTEEEVKRGAAGVEAAFFDFLRELGYSDDGLPKEYAVARVGETSGDAVLWCASDADYGWHAYIIELPEGDAEVFVSYSETIKEHRLSPDAAEAISVDVIAELGFDHEAWASSLLASLEKAYGKKKPVKKAEDGLPGDEYVVVKADEEQRYTLGVAYPANDLDSHGDFTTEEELESAAWNYMIKSRGVGTDHEDGTDGAGIAVESYIYRGPNWGEGDQEIRSGDWLLGVVWNENTWDRIKKNELTGFSIQGLAERYEEEVADDT